MVRTQIQNPALQEIADVPDRVIGVELALRGAFKEEIASLDARLSELDAKLGAVADVEAAAKIREEADAYAIQVRADMAELTQRTSDAAGKVSAKLSAVEAREMAVGARESAASNRTAQLDSREAGILEAQRTKDAELTEREGSVSIGERDLRAARAQLAKDQADFNRRLESLKV